MNENKRKENSKRRKPPKKDCLPTFNWPSDREAAVQAVIFDDEDIWWACVDFGWWCGE